MEVLAERKDELKQALYLYLPKSQTEPRLKDSLCKEVFHAKSQNLQCSERNGWEEHYED